MSTVESARGDFSSRDMPEHSARAASLQPSDNIDFASLLAAFRRRLWTFLITVAATIALVVAFLILYRPDYTATARVTINPRTIAATPDRESPVVSQLTTSSNNVDTEVQVIESRRVTERVIQALQLDQDPEFSGGPGGFKEDLTNFFLMFFHASHVVSPGDRVIDAVLGHLDPERFLETNAIDINFKDKDPEKAQKLANAFAQAYLEDQVEAKAQQARQAASALLSQIDAMRKQAADDSDKVQAYKIAHNLLSVGAQTLTEQEISGYDQAVATAKAEAAADQANLRIAQDQLTRGSSGEDVGAALSSPVVAELRAQKAVLASKLADLEGHYGPKYPDLAQVRREVSSIDLEIQAEILRSISNLSAKANVSQKRLASLEGTLDATKGVLAANNAAESGLDDLTRAATVSQAIYEAYLQRFKESTAQLSSLMPDADIVSMAGLPSDPSFPIAWLFLLLGVVAGLLFGAAAVLFAEMLDDRLYTGEDVERDLHRPCLGGVPLLVPTRKGANAQPIDAVIKRTASGYSEALRGLLTSVKLAGQNGALRVLLVTSVKAGDGKTTIAAGLARTSALQGVPTVLVDCDVRGRGGSLARDLKIDDPGPGLIAVLKGEVQLADALRRDEESGVMVLPMSEGATPSDDLMGGIAMDALLASLRRAYGAVILDAPPIPIAVARVLAAKADATILVAAWRARAADGLRAALRLQPFDQPGQVGVVLNRIDVALQSRYGFGQDVTLQARYGVGQSGDREKKSSHHYA